MADAFGQAFGDAFGCGSACGCAQCRGIGTLGSVQFSPDQIMSLVQSGVQVTSAVAPLFKKTQTAPSGLVPVSAPTPAPAPVAAPAPAPSGGGWVGPVIGVGAFALFGGLVVLLMRGGSSSSKAA